jgi:tetratricopeptide (TPR) repeat protein
MLLARGHHELAYEPGSLGARLAEPFLRQSSAMYQALADRYPNEAEYSLMQAEVETGLARMLQSLGDKHAAIERHQKAIAHLDRLRAMEPSNVTYQVERAVKHNDLSRTLLSQGNAKGALVASRTAFDALEAIDPAFAQAGTMVRARVRVGYHLALSIEGTQGPAAPQACRLWIATLKLLPSFMPRAGGMRGGVDPARVTAAAQACEGNDAAPGTPALAGHP